MATKKHFNSFEEMLAGSDVPVLVDFYAEWCGPCKMMATILDQVNAQLKDRLRIVKIDTEKYTQLATEYRIEALPTLMLFKDGQPVDKIEGVVQAQQLVQHLQGLI
jgi:thioredoxin